MNANRKTAERQMQSLKDNSVKVPDCYQDFNDFLWDYFPDFAWNGNCKIQAKYVLEHKDFKSVAEAIQKNHNYNIKNALNVFIFDDEEKIELDINGNITKGHELFKKGLALI